MKIHKSFLIVAVLGIAFQACKPNYQEQLASVNTERTTKVKVMRLQKTNAPIPIEASGVLQSKAQAGLSFKVGGIVDQILVDEGDAFRKGQVLARLELTEINARVLQAEENVKKLSRDKDRVLRLYKDTVATLEQLENITTALEVAQADLDVASYNKAYATIVAKENGKVLKRMTERGELLAAGQPVFQVALNGRSKSHILKIGVADRDVVKVQLGDSARVQLDAYPGQYFKANVTEVAEAADPRTGTFELELTLKSETHVFKDGFVAKLRLYPSSQAPYYKIPMTALVEANEDEATIYIPKDQSVERMKVTPIVVGDDYFIISADNSISIDQVVTQGSAYAKPGEIVEILKEQP
ncbi:hypothetical protein BFP97_09095 [Roseivirga sp. 4D4]|uniref:efflux RND transporter periplasmic adaptor subunit n=1 Tax=Roseivirga sp. 4D4 TaxID=1889784 RepID=UPI00085353BB|nr:efflux RND transporter periplasmic adaptor subunit [Roseivirga sp. 4D4]OEK01660.1 hypothetical protein BFP97_09095 [Roseivirga sp. 4D4]